MASRHFSNKRRISNWRCVWPGKAMGCPSGNPGKTARGGRTFVVICSDKVIEMVAIPELSIARWISPTD